MKRVSRRDFGKKVSGGVLGGLAASSLTPLAMEQEQAGASAQAPKRMTSILREMIKSPGIIDSPSIYDPLTARIAESVGFRYVNLPGSARGIVTCQMEPALSLEDLAEATRGIAAAVNIPLLVDAGGGFGEPAHVFHTIRVLERAGASGCCIEDQVFPKRFHYYMDDRVDAIPAEAMIEKIRYAVRARRDPDFVIGARTEALSTQGFAEGVRRANLYLAAGADYVLLFPRTVEETKQLPKEVHGPLNFVNAEQGLPERPNFTAQELGTMGWRMLNHPDGAILLYYKTMKDAFVRLKETGSMGMDPVVYGPIYKEVYRMIDLWTYYNIEYWTHSLGNRGVPGTGDPAFTWPRR
jgi:2-methylisocitrate lyase-like PEP mutase family enzyme